MKKQVTVENDTYNYSDVYDYDEKVKKEKIPLTHRTGSKIFAFILAVVMTFITALSAMTAVFMIADEVYTTPKDRYIQEKYSFLVQKDMNYVIWELNNNPETFAELYFEHNPNIQSVLITDDKGKDIYSYSAGDSSNEVYEFIYYDFYNKYYDCLYFNDEVIDFSEHINIAVKVFKDPVENSNYSFAKNCVDFLYAISYSVYFIVLIGLVCVIVCFVFLLRAVGHRKGNSNVQNGILSKIPFDILIVVMGIVTVFFCEAIIYLYEQLVYQMHPTYYIQIHHPFIEIGFSLEASLIATVIAFSLIVLSMSFALRIKLGKWWENTVIYRVVCFVFKCAKKIFKGIKKLVINLIYSIPLVWKTALVLLGIIIINFIIMICCWWEPDNQLIWFVITSTAISGVVMYCAVNIKKLQQANQELAQGNLSYRVNTDKMIGDFKLQGESINNIAEGMNLAVEKQLRSERMKTELITNVSHDIKTPLTSIINYTDLIAKEPCNNEKISEYSQVLLRQSNRLKRLIDDLVEVSKATTGNMEVDLMLSDANIFIDQVAGEYQEKLKEKNLEIVISKPEKSVLIMADGRRMWRVFDNLFNNIYKYAQNGTRVYLSLEQKQGEAVITLKNISNSPLNITADELMERFVRGDSSRNVEGNGLGLSIARSLTELQKGKFEIAIDGDLFKVIIKFPIK